MSTDDLHRRRPFPDELGPQPAINRFLDGVAGARDELCGCHAPAYLVLGVCGIAFSFVVLAGLGLFSGLPLAIALVLTVSSLSLFVGAGLVRKAFVGTDRHVLFQDVLIVLGGGAAVTWALGQPVRSALDVHVLSLGCFLVFGRLGCLVSGCCHGRPCLIGIRYPREDALSGVRLFPVQLAEALWLLLATLAGSFFVLGRAAPGTAVAFWLVAYSAGRFVLEFARGDLERARLGPLSEAQWTALLVVLSLVVHEEVSRPRLDILALGALAAALTLAGLGYATRSRWLVLPGPELSVDEVGSWQAMLVQLERHARTVPAGQGASARSPLRGVDVELVIDKADGGNEVHAFTLRRGEGVILGERLAFTLAGVILQRLPKHRLMRASFCVAGNFHTWALVEPSGPPASTAGENPRLILYRAREMARLARLAPPKWLPSEAELDPSFLPPVEPPPATRLEPRHLPPPESAAAPARSPFERPFGSSPRSAPRLEGDT
jgi:hypothetical protein